MIVRHLGIPLSEQHMQTELKARRADDLDILTLIMEISELGIDIPIDDAYFFITLGDLFAALERVLARPLSNAPVPESDYEAQTIRLMLAGWLEIEPDRITPQTIIHGPQSLDDTIFWLLLTELELIHGYCIEATAVKGIRTFQDLLDMLVKTPRN